MAFRAIGRMRELTSEGALTDAVRVLAGVLFNQQDVAAAEQAGYFEATGRYVPTMLDFFDQQSRYEGPTPDEPTVLGAISVPVLILQGTHTAPYAAATALHVAHHVRNARIQQVAGAGHALPLTHPEALAGALEQSSFRLRRHRRCVRLGPDRHDADHRQSPSPRLCVRTSPTAPPG